MRVHADKCLRAARRRDVEFSACRRVVYKVQLAW